MKTRINNLIITESSWTNFIQNNIILLKCQLKAFYFFSSKDA